MIVDASIIDAPSSTKNKDGGRDKEMHQTKKGNQWYFCMKAHVGVDAESGLAHSLETTPAGVETAHTVLRGGEAAETRKASVRTKVEHPFRYVKRILGYDKVRYRGIGPSQ